MDDARFAAAVAHRYRIEQLLASGSMAVVYLARDLKLERQVVLKVLRPEIATVLGVERFLAEIKITARLDHPHILTLIDSGSADDFLYYVLPYVRGESLRARLDREAPLGIDESLAIARQVASALDYAHRHGVVHRDVKPENILLHEGVAMLTDFGIALAVTEAAGPRLTSTGFFVGTPQYMSPEQASGDRELDARTDVYALAAVLFEMLAGEPVVGGDSVQATVAKLMTERPPRLRALLPTVPDHVDEAVAKALSLNPAERYPSAAAFADALGGSAGSRPAAAAPWWSRRIGVVAVALAAVAATALGVMGGHLLRNSGQTSLVALTDRRQLTYTGDVRLPAISSDGRELAVMRSDCGVHGCTYGIEMQDVDEPARRRVVDSARAIYQIGFSEDSRYLLFTGRVGDRFGAFTVSVFGGPPRHVSAGIAAFFAGSDSLLVLRSSREREILVATRDGIVRDSILPEIAGGLVMGITDVPRSPWIALRVERADTIEIVTIDRQGRLGDRFGVPRGAGITRASSHALWYAPGVEQKSRIIRVPLDPESGRFGGRHDTVYVGTTWGFDVTPDGGRLVLDEGSYDYGAWALSLDEALEGALTPERRIEGGSAKFTARLSPDGSTVLLERGLGPWFDSATAYSYSLVPFGGGPAKPQPLAAVSRTEWEDSTTLAVAEVVPGGTRFYLLDVRTGQKRAELQVPEEKIWVFAPLADGGWAWIRPGDAGLGIQRAGEPQPWYLPPPDWCANLFAIATSSDGRTLLIAGFDEATGDSMRVEQISLTDGHGTVWVTEPAEFGYLAPLSDGSFLFARSEAQHEFDLERLRGPGRVERLGTIPHPITWVSASADLGRVVISAYEYRGDIYMWRVVRR